MRQSRQLTIRGMDARVEREIRDLARRERISINKAATRLLEKGAGIRHDTGKLHSLLRDGQDDRIGATLDHLIGTWSNAEAESFLKSIASCEQIDKELWS